MPRLGILSRLYINLNASSLTTNFQVLNLISDCVVNAPWEEGDASARLTRAKLTEPTMMALEVTGKIRVRHAEQDPAFVRMRDFYYRDLSFDVMVLNGLLTENDSEGFIFPAKVFNWSEDQSLGTVLYKDFSLKPCIYDGTTVFPPRYCRVIGGTLTTFLIGQG
jgi:hypothetical protein